MDKHSCWKFSLSVCAEHEHSLQQNACHMQQNACHMHARRSIELRGLDCAAAVQHSQRDVHAPRIAKEGVTYEILVFSDLQKKGKGRM